jgi:hypothetical protein
MQVPTASIACAPHLQEPKGSIGSKRTSHLGPIMNSLIYLSVQPQGHLDSLSSQGCIQQSQHQDHFSQGAGLAEGSGSVVLSAPLGSTQGTADLSGSDPGLDSVSLPRTVSELHQISAGQDMSSVQGYFDEFLNTFLR